MCSDLLDFPSPPSLNWGKYSSLRPSEIVSILVDNPIAYVPWGALEWHSLHAPIGLDSTKAEGICCALAQMTGGVVLPAIPLATNTIKPFKGFPHSVEISSRLISDLAEEICCQLADEGFRIVILFTGHYPPEQIEALEKGAVRARNKYADTTFKVCADNQFIEGGPFVADHAGAYETSFQMFFEPDSVSLSALPDKPLTLDDDGITGEDPRKASASRGGEQLDLVLSNALPLIEFWKKELKIET